MYKRHNEENMRQQTISPKITWNGIHQRKKKRKKKNTQQVHSAGLLPSVLPALTLGVASSSRVRIELGGADLRPFLSAPTPHEENIRDTGRVDPTGVDPQKQLRLF